MFPLPGLPSSSHPPNESPLIFQALPALCGFPWSVQASKPLMTLHGMNRAMLAHLWFKRVLLTPLMALASLYFTNLHVSLSSFLYCEFLDGRNCDLFISGHSVNVLELTLFFFSPLLNNSSDYQKQTLKGIVSLRWGEKSPWLPTSKIHENMTKKKETLSNKLRMS